MPRGLCKICSSRNQAYQPVQIPEVSRLIYLHDFSWLNALLLKAEIFTVDASLSDLFYIKFHHHFMCRFSVTNL